LSDRPFPKTCWQLKLHHDPHAATTVTITTTQQQQQQQPPSFKRCVDSVVPIALLQHLFCILFSPMKLQSVGGGTSIQNAVTYVMYQLLLKSLAGRQYFFQGFGLITSLLLQRRTPHELPQPDNCC
jgi:hypothetical protein